MCCTSNRGCVQFIQDAIMGLYKSDRVIGLQVLVVGYIFIFSMEKKYDRST
jgi:hypothetical protein